MNMRKSRPSCRRSRQPGLGPRPACSSPPPNSDRREPKNCSVFPFSSLLLISSLVYVFLPHTFDSGPACTPPKRRPSFILKEYFRLCFFGVF